MKHPITFFITVFSLCLAGIFFTGCSNTVPDIVALETLVIYDYTSMQEEPTQKLSVFTQSSGGSERIMRLEVSFPEAKICWTIDKPLILNNGSKIWAGSANLMPPYFGSLPQGFPQGKYEVSYMDLAGEIAKSQFYLAYEPVSDPPLNQPIFSNQEEQPSSDSSKDAAPSDDSSAEPVKKIAIFSGSDGTGTLLFFDKGRDDWKSLEDITKTYSKAKSLRISLDYPSRQVRYLLPAHNFESGAQ